MRPDGYDQSFAARLVALALLIAVLCNGTSAYLKRTGLIDGEAYRAYWSIHCKADDPARIAGSAEPRCSADAARQGAPSITSPEDEARQDHSWLYIFETSIRDAWPVCLLLGYVLISFLVSLPLNGALVAASGLRAMTFATIALVTGWLAPHLGVVARCLGALMVAQALLIPFELFRGIHLFGEWTHLALAARASGTMVNPNSLGIFAAASLAFLYSFCPTRRWTAPLGIVTLACALASGSGTGIVCTAVIAFFVLRENTPETRRDLVTILGLAAALFLYAALPSISGRQNIFDSILGDGGRVHHIFAAFMQRGSLETLFGSGLGAGSNAAWSLVYDPPSDAAGVPSPYETFRADSTLGALVIQIGAAGALLFYAVLLWAALRDRPGRLFYGIIALCSLATNVTELFPVNFLLGIALARSVRRE